MRKHGSVWIAAAAALLATACASTKLTDVWRDPAYTGSPLERVMVVGVARRDGSSRLLETELARELRERGVDAVPAHRLLRTDRVAADDRLHATARKHGMRGVIVATVLDVDRETRVVPGSTHVVHRHGMGAYHRSRHTVVHTPARRVRVRIAMLETNLYRVDGDALVWSGTSETFERKSVAGGIRDFSAVLAERLVADGVVGAPAP